MQGFDGDWVTQVFASKYSRVTSIIHLVHWAIKRTFNAHRVWNRLEPATHLAQYVEELGLDPEGDLTLFQNLNAMSARILVKIFW